MNNRPALAVLLLAALASLLSAQDSSPPEIPEALEVQHLSKPPRLTRPVPPVNPYATRVAGGKPVVVRAKAPFRFTRVDDPGAGQAARDEEELK